MSLEGVQNSSLTIEERTKSHPCYSGGCQNARIHLPIAPACNISCNYCNRKYDCVNESRPGVTSDVLNPQQALERFLKVKSKMNHLKVVGIAGPGDALANFESTRKTLELIREADPDITFCLSTNGLMLPYFALDLAKLGVTHVTVTLNTVDPKIGARIYRNIQFHGLQLDGEKGARFLLENQLAGIKLLVALGIVCKINTVLIKGVNDQHIEDVVKKVKELGAFISNIMPLIPAPGSAFEHMPLTSNKELNDIRKASEVHLKQMYHCRQCRADAIGSLGEDCSAEFREKVPEVDKSIEISVRYTFAVASKSGRLVDEHFGHAREFHVYQYENGRLRFLEKRPVGIYCTGTEECDDEEKNLDSIIKTVEDCDILLVQRIGFIPQKRLEASGKKVVQTYGAIEEEIRKAVLHLQRAAMETTAV